jgi:tetratricopeptide (TPR) repeat protein
MSTTGWKAAATLATAACALFALASTGCMAHGKPTERQWRELRTDRILLTTDLEGDDARERAREFERLAAALSDLYAVVVPRRPAPVQPIRVIHLARCADLTSRYGEGVGGLMVPSVDFGGERLVLTCEHGDQLRSGILVHELTHDLNYRHMNDLPPWLQEGLATYYETLRLEDGVAVLGLRPMMDRRYWRGVSILPDMTELMAMTPQQLVGDAYDRRGYFAAWKLTHLLANGSLDHLRRFRRMLSIYASGGGRKDAFTASYGDIADQLARDYKSYHLRGELNVWRVVINEAAARGVLSERTLRPGEAIALFIQLRPLGSKERMRAERAELVDRLERADPKWPRRLYWRALVQARSGGDLRGAARLLREYVALEPNDGQGWLGLVSLELGRVLPKGHLGVEPEAPPRLAEIEDEVRELLRVSNTSSQLSMIGWYYALRRQPNIGLNFALRALQLEPGDADTWDTLALLYHHAGRAQEAVAAQKRAIDLMVESRRGVDSSVRARLRHYEQVAARAPAPPSS